MEISQHTQSSGFSVSDINRKQALFGEAISVNLQFVLTHRFVFNISDMQLHWRNSFEETSMKRISFYRLRPIVIVIWLLLIASWRIARSQLFVFFVKLLRHRHFILNNPLFEVQHMICALSHCEFAVVCCWCAVKFKFQIQIVNHQKIY